MTAARQPPVDARPQQPVSYIPRIALDITSSGLFSNLDGETQIPKSVKIRPPRQRDDGGTLLTRPVSNLTADWSGVLKPSNNCSPASGNMERVGPATLECRAGHSKQATSSTWCCAVEIQMKKAHLAR